jgi:hypothetical protein
MGGRGLISIPLDISALIDMHQLSQAFGFRLALPLIGAR